MKFMCARLILSCLCVLVCAALPPSFSAQTPESGPAATDAAPQPARAPEESDRLPFMAQESDAGAGSAPSVGGLVVRALGALLLIVGLIVATGFGLRKFGMGRTAAAGSREQLAVLSTVTLGDRRSLSVVSFNGRTLLVGSTPHSFTLLASESLEDSDDTALSDSSDSDAAEPSTRRSVAEMLRGDDGERNFEEEFASALRRAPRSITEEAS